MCVWCVIHLIHFLLSVICNHSLTQPPIFLHAFLFSYSISSSLPPPVLQTQSLNLTAILWKLLSKLTDRFVQRTLCRLVAAGAYSCCTGRMIKKAGYYHGAVSYDNTVGGCMMEGKAAQTNLVPKAEWVTAAYFKVYTYVTEVNCRQLWTLIQFMSLILYLYTFVLC